MNDFARDAYMRFQHSTDERSQHFVVLVQKLLTSTWKSRRSSRREFLRFISLYRIELWSLYSQCRCHQIAEIFSILDSSTKKERKKGKDKEFEHYSDSHCELLHFWWCKNTLKYDFNLTHGHETLMQMQMLRKLLPGLVFFYVFLLSGCDYFLNY